MFSESVKVSMALCCIWAWLIPHFYIEYMEYRLALLQSRREASNTTDADAGAATSSEGGNNVKEQQDEGISSHQVTITNNIEDDDDSDNSSRTVSLDEANLALLQGVAAAILIIIVVYTASALGISLPTKHMDRRASAIVVGIGRIMSALLFAVFSVEIPKWLGVTYSSQRSNYYKQQVSHTHKLKELSFRVCWSILGHFFMMYFIMLMYFTNPTRFSIPISTAIGIGFGFGVVWAVYIGRTTYKRHTTLIAFVFSFVIMVSSAAAFSAGCWYIKEVWYEEDIGFQEEYTLITFFGWLSLCVIANALYYRLTRRKLKAAATDGNSTTGVSSTGVGADFSDARSTWRYQSQLFQPPDSVCFAATELSKATAHVAVATVRSPFKRAGSTISRMRTSSFGSASKNSSRNAEEASLDRNESPIRRMRASSADAGTSDQLPHATPIRVRTNTEPTTTGTSSVISPLNNRSRSYSDTSYSSNTLSNCDDPLQSSVKSETAMFPPLSPSMEENFRQSLVHNPLDTIKTGVALSFGEDLADHGLSFESSGHDSSGFDYDIGLPNRPSLDVEEAIIEEEESNDERSKGNEKDPSLWFMIKTNSCCGKRRHYKAPPRKRWERRLNFMKWFCWGIISAMHLYFVIICIGATAQQERVRRALPGTFSLLYPPDYVQSTMCAWNESSPNADIRTFESLDEVLEANYTVIHCGACGSCSNWNDLSLQWTTRSNLASLGQECVKKKLFGGTEDDVQECNEELIGFTEDCSTCWTEDQLCAKKNCVFIYLQSLLVNQVSNFNVDPDDITSTTCDEALCGPEFVPCSGATRRRMNIVSDIPRPVDQQCVVANEDWSTIFHHP